MQGINFFIFASCELFMLCMLATDLCKKKKMKFQDIVKMKGLSQESMHQY